VSSFACSKSPAEVPTMVQVAEHIHTIIQKGHCRFSIGPKISKTRIRKTSLCHLRNFAPPPVSPLAPQRPSGELPISKLIVDSRFTSRFILLKSPRESQPGVQELSLLRIVLSNRPSNLRTFRYSHLSPLAHSVYI
jgi:hypothetical protein